MDTDILEIWCFTVTVIIMQESVISWGARGRKTRLMHLRSGQGEVNTVNTAALSYLNRRIVGIANVSTTERSRFAIIALQVVVIPRGPTCQETNCSVNRNVSVTMVMVML